MIWRLSKQQFGLIVTQISNSIPKDSANDMKSPVAHSIRLDKLINTKESFFWFRLYLMIWSSRNNNSGLLSLKSQILFPKTLRMIWTGQWLIQSALMCWSMWYQAIFDFDFIWWFEGSRNNKFVALSPKSQILFQKTLRIIWTDQWLIQSALMCWSIWYRAIIIFNEFSYIFCTHLWQTLWQGQSCWLRRERLALLPHASLPVACITVRFPTQLLAPLLHCLPLKHCVTAYTISYPVHNCLSNPLTTVWLSTLLTSLCLPLTETLYVSLFYCLPPIYITLGLTTPLPITLHHCLPPYSTACRLHHWK
jgi:hypothetical protein